MNPFDLTQTRSIFVANYLSLLRDTPVPLIVHGLSEVEVPDSLAFLRAASQRASRPHAML